jgi:hypothetical protein
MIALLNPHSIVLPPEAALGSPAGAQSSGDTLHPGGGFGAWLERIGSKAWIFSGRAAFNRVPLLVPLQDVRFAVVFRAASGRTEVGCIHKKIPFAGT